MAEEKPKRTRKRRPKHSSMHMTIWSMNGEPIPEATIREAEAALVATLDASEVRLLSNVVRF